MSNKSTTWIVLAILIIGGAAGIYKYASRPIATDTISESEVPAQSTEESSEASIVDTSGTVQYALTADTKASFAIDEMLRGSPFKVIGTTSDVSGSIYIDQKDLSASKLGPILVDARTLRTDDAMRDGAITRFILKSNTSGNEQIRFTATSIEGLPKGAGESVANFTIAGDLVIRGISKPVVFKASDVKIAKERLSGTAQATIKRSDYNLQIPNIPFVANVPDEFGLTLSFVAVPIQIRK